VRAECEQRSRQNFAKLILSAELIIRADNFIGKTQQKWRFLQQNKVIFVSHHIAAGQYRRAIQGVARSKKCLQNFFAPTIIERQFCASTLQQQYGVELN
jgi:hypothetical protein